MMSANGWRHGLQNKGDRKSTRLNSSHLVISYAVFCLKKKKQQRNGPSMAEPVSDGIGYCHSAADTPVAVHRGTPSLVPLSCACLFFFFFFFFNDTATTEIYTLALHDALPICWQPSFLPPSRVRSSCCSSSRSEEHTSELQSPCNLVCRLLLEKKKQQMKSREHGAQRTATHSAQVGVHTR